MNIKKIIKWGILAIITVSLLFLAYRSSSSSPGKYDQFTKCLTDKGLAMYGSDLCPHCLNQKALFGNSFKFINYKNCDFNKVLCDLNNVRSYPTWIYKDKSVTGEQSLETLAIMTNCEIDK